MATKSLYIGNIPYRTPEEEIRSIFESYGPISSVRVIGDKGFAFVEIPEENMAAAIEGTNDKELGGRTLTVNEARPREPRSDNRGGGRFNRGGGRGGYDGGAGRSRR